VPTDCRQGLPRGAVVPHVPGTVDQAAGYPAYGLTGLRRLGREVRPEQVLVHPGRQPGGHRVGQRGHHDDLGVGVAAVTEQPLEPETDPAAEDRHHGAGGGGHRVRHHQLGPGHHVRERGRQPGQEEPVHRQAGEHGGIEGYAGHVRRAEPGHAEHHGGAEQVGHHQDLPPPPPVEQHTRERADQRVGQQQGRERGRNTARRRLPLRREEEQARERGLERAVGGLRRQPGREQPAEVAVPHDGTEVAGEAHAWERTAGVVAHMTKRTGWRTPEGAASRSASRCRPRAV
jgi:hypothetical protein